MTLARDSKKIRLLVVDDSAVFREMLTQAVSLFPEIEVVGGAPTLARSKAFLEKGAVDAVTIDVQLRHESGLDLLPWLREHAPNVLPILVTRGSDENARIAVDALLLGAAALLLKPDGAHGVSHLASELTRILLAAREGKSPRSFLSSPPRNLSPLPPPRRSLSPAKAAGPFAARREVIAIGASTGGPPVLLEFLQALPPTFSTPILITQHMPKDHIEHFVSLLVHRTARKVVPARHELLLERGVTYVASEGKHMVLARGERGLFLLQDDGPPEHHCKPAVDCMFRSVASVCGSAAVGVVMTGMGTDGASGAIALREKGAPIVVQDEATSVVWGMPGATFAVGAASVVAPAEALAFWVLRWTQAT